MVTLVLIDWYVNVFFEIIPCNFKMSERGHMTKDAKTEFSNRLNYALDLFGVPRKGNGRHNTVAEMFGVSSKAARKWLEGESFPETNRLLEIAQRLDINFDWLRFGSGIPNKINFLASLPHVANINNSFTNPEIYKAIPVILWEAVPKWDGKMGEEKKDAQWIQAAVDEKYDYYGLVMSDDLYSPILPQGAILVIARNMTPLNKSKVIIHWENTQQTSCYILIFDGPNKYLKSFSENYNLIPIKPDLPMKICGIIKQIFIQE